MSSSIDKSALAGRRSQPASMVGQLIADKYRLVRALGHGGMGTVYKAENVAIGKVVAIKLLHRNLAEDPIAMQRFHREARATVAISHPNIVEVLDMGNDTGGLPYLVMEYVRGTNLKKILRSAGPLPVERAARIGGQVASALAGAHARGIIHRDLKPENILLKVSRSGPEHVKVVDFGISTFVDAMAERERQLDLTPTGLTMATPFYASPEQIRGAKGRDPRVDIYALGVLLYEMLSAHRPFEGDNLPELCTRILSGEIAPLSVFRRDVPEALELVVRRALAPKVQERFQHAEEVALALVPFGADRPRGDEADPTDTFNVDMRSLGISGLETLRGQPLPSALAYALLSYFAQRHGDRALAVASELGLSAQGLRTQTECDSELLARVLARLDGALGRGDRAEIIAAGRHLAHTLVGSAELPASTTPELFFSLAGALWDRHFDLGEARVVSVGRGYGRLEIRGELRRPVALTLALLGLIEEGLRLSGARGVNVRLVSCSALGDAADAFEASWS
jgi:tRNA A-37 threonylcarbamoyl transferase component Bud32